MFALIDCDNFFVSCERIFQPKLKNIPVVVLSNNDGCVVARSAEAKALGVTMACPFFKIEKMFRAQGGVALSSNYELYADISKRVMSLIQQEFQNLEIYSIDEAFVELKSSDRLYEIGLKFHQKILKEVGVSVSIGIAPTKTLCKLAIETAKKMPKDKVFVLTEEAKISEIIKQTEVIDIWGIGKNTAQKLNFMGIFTGEELRLAPLSLIKKSLGINTEKTALELNRFACLEMENHSQQKSIISSRSFEKEISQFNDLEQIISEFVDSACLRLRQQHSLASGIIVFIASNRFHLSQQQYQNSVLVPLPYPTNNTAKFLQAMKFGLNQIFKDGIFYKRAGVTLVDIQDQNLKQQNLLFSSEQNLKEQKLMSAFDEINAKLGKKTLYFGIQKSGQQYFIKRQFKSRNYTTSWADLPVVH